MPMVASYIAPAGISALSGIEVVVDVQTAATALPPWWDVNTGGCRENALRASYVSCCWQPDLRVGLAVARRRSAVSAAFRAGEGGPNRGRMIIGWAVAPTNTRPLMPDARVLRDEHHDLACEHAQLQWLSGSGVRRAEPDQPRAAGRHDGWRSAGDEPGDGPVRDLPGWRDQRWLPRRDPDPESDLGLGQVTVSLNQQELSDGRPQSRGRPFFFGPGAPRRVRPPMDRGGPALPLVDFVVRSTPDSCRIEACSASDASGTRAARRCTTGDQSTSHPVSSPAVGEPQSSSSHPSPPASL